jgi:hypothetical protein
MERKGVEGGWGRKERSNGTNLWGLFERKEAWHHGLEGKDNGHQGSTERERKTRRSGWSGLARLTSLEKYNIWCVRAPIVRRYTNLIKH